MADWSITITPIPKTEDATVTTSDGQTFTVRGLALFADGGDGNLFSFFWNSPHAAASGCYRSCAEAIKRDDPFATQFYKCLLKLFALGTGAQATKVVAAEDVLRRWEAEEVYKAASEDPKKFN